MAVSDKDLGYDKGYTGWGAGGAQIPESIFDAQMSTLIDRHRNRNEPKDPFTGTWERPLPKFPSDPHERLKYWFKTFKKGEPYPVTKERIDRVKGFVDTLSHVNDPIGYIEQFHEAKDPKKLFKLYPDGFHTPASKVSSHPTFRKNSWMQQMMSKIVEDRFKR